MRSIGFEHLRPVIARDTGSKSPFLITCDHAGREVPRELGDLGLPPEAFERHIAWDIGAGALSLRLGDALGACITLGVYSRLVIDLNRAPGRPDSIPDFVDGTAIPANEALTEADAAARAQAIHEPYHRAIAAELDWRERQGLSTVVLFIHSFTPRLAGRDRPWTVGVLHAHDSPFSDAMLALLSERTNHVVGDNQPYTMDETDYSAGRHARARGLDYLELEVRQDLIAEPEGVARIADQLAPLLAAALSGRSGG